MEDRSEEELFLKVTGIEEARNNTKPVPKGVKIPKKLRRVRTGRRCFKCGLEVAVHSEDSRGIWHYRCPECVRNQPKEDPNPCPRCKCKAHAAYEFEDSGCSNPFAPANRMLCCLNCGFSYPSAEFERYMLTRVIREVGKDSPFREK